jgi:hypothetical protein
MQRLFETEHRQDMANGLYFGLTLTLILYNLFVFLSLKEKTYLYYVLYILFLSQIVALTYGYGLEFLYPTLPWLNHTNYWSVPSTVFGILFTDAFLQVGLHAPYLRRLSWVLYLVLLGVSALTLSGNLLAGFRVQLLLNFLLVPYVFIVGITVYRKGFRPARFYLLAFACLTTGIAIYTLKDHMILPQTPFTESTLQLGSALEAIILSFALAYRLNTFKLEKEQAQAEALKQANAFSRQLIGGLAN